MARFAVLYNTQRPGLDKVIEADTYKVDAKFFTFFQDKEVVRSLKVDIVVQIRRMNDNEEGEGEQPDSVEQIRARSSAKRSTSLERTRLRAQADEG